LPVGKAGFRWPF